MPNIFIKRTTLLQVPREEDINDLLQRFEVMRKAAVKDGQPYILFNSSERVINTSEPRSEGFTLVSQSVFKTLEDHEFYDRECPAHKALKEAIAKVRTGVMTIVTQGEWPELKHQCKS